MVLKCMQVRIYENSIHVSLKKVVYPFQYFPALSLPGQAPAPTSSTSYTGLNKYSFPVFTSLH